MQINWVLLLLMSEASKIEKGHIVLRLSFEVSIGMCCLVTSSIWYRSEEWIKWHIDRGIIAGQQQNTDSIHLFSLKLASRQSKTACPLLVKLCVFHWKWCCQLFAAHRAINWTLITSKWLQPLQLFRDISKIGISKNYQQECLNKIHNQIENEKQTPYRQREAETGALKTTSSVKYFIIVVRC